MEFRCYFRVPLDNKKSAVTVYGKPQLVDQVGYSKHWACDVALSSLSASNVVVVVRGESEGSKGDLRVRCAKTKQLPSDTRRAEPG